MEKQIIYEKNIEKTFEGYKVFEKGKKITNWKKWGPKFEISIIYGPLKPYYFDVIIFYFLIHVFPKLLVPTFWKLDKN